MLDVIILVMENAKVLVFILVAVVMDVVLPIAKILV